MYNVMLQDVASRWVWNYSQHMVVILSLGSSYICFASVSQVIG